MRIRGMITEICFCTDSLVRFTLQEEGTRNNFYVKSGKSRFTGEVGGTYDMEITFNVVEKVRKGNLFYHQNISLKSITETA